MDEAGVREIARQEIASLCGLVLSRTSEEHFTRSIDRNTAEDVVADRLSAIFGEALADFSGHTGSGAAPGA
jgi:hypothetical protein